MQFSHLHVHTQYSLLDGAASISGLFKKAVNDKMPAIAITDHGNMFGVFNFVAEAAKINRAAGKEIIKPVVGCEFYLVENRHQQTFTKGNKDKRFHQLLLAKNAEGYSNLIKLCSAGFTEGIYGKYPRIDKELLLKYHKGLIATTCCLGAIIPKTILADGQKEAEKEFLWWLNLFGDDYYIELQRHDIPEQKRVNDVLQEFSKKHLVKTIATNDSPYVDQEDYNAHDILLCINTGEKKQTPSIKEFSDDDIQVKGKRFAFYNDQFYFKTTQEMTARFIDIPEAIDNTNEIVSKVETLNLEREVLLPHFQIPKGFSDQNAYLKYLAYEGAQKRYGDMLTEAIRERLDYELFTIKTMGYEGYFLIVSDFIRAGREMGVFVGPGRGSAAGSAVAYCLGITNIDPIKYDLLFERFLNPDRKSLPDIDTDFDDEGRQKVIDYTVKKYGSQQVAQIITYGTMAAKMSIRDVARVLDLPLDKSDALAKMVPEKPGISLKRILLAPVDGEDGLKTKEELKEEDLIKVKHLRQLYAGEQLEAEVLRQAVKLEGSVRNTGVHAAGIIIAPKNLTDIIPIAVAKESSLYISQFEGEVIEKAGVIKMDFLGLKTLTIIRDTLEMIRSNHGLRLDIDTIPLDDTKTLELFQRGETNGIFQFESVGMQKNLRELKPDKFGDLIAMNALYRPGPMEKIQLYINRKHGKEGIVYDVPGSEDILAETYGITVYQEQVMLLSQRLAGFTKGDADVLRKAMGKKQKAVLAQMKDKFIKGATDKGYPGEKIQKIWSDWEAFAQYAFNKSHSTCYAFLAFQTAYLKVHYPEEYMAAVLTNHIQAIDKITFFLEECRRMNLPVLRPDLNESTYNFSVNPKREIRFGLAAIKGVGQAAASAIIEDRNTNGPFISVFDYLTRLNSRIVNKKCHENLVKAGAFDTFTDIHRAQYFASDNQNLTGLDKAIRYSSTLQDLVKRRQVALFDDSDAKENLPLAVPRLPDAPEWSLLEKLHYEKDVIGFYISGHPLDMFHYEIRHFCNSTISQFNNPELWSTLIHRGLFSFAGIVTKAVHRISKSGKRFGLFTIEDTSGSIEIPVWNEKKYIEFEKYLKQDMFLFVKASIQEHYRVKNKFEFIVSEMRLLSEVGDDLAKSITILADSSFIDDQAVNQLQHLIEAYEGRIPLKMAFKDPVLQYKAEGIARRIRVKFDKGLLSALERCPGLSLKVN
ncbi:MAG: DNA polymerase III subunit alpha [Bacteroidia bacterium]|nr:DNA polymerase III subunit alpha [Bacteroidia bacterium]